MISRVLGVVSGLLIVAQAWFLARILHRMIMENIPATALLLPFTLLVLVFVLRAWVVWLRERVGFQAGQHIPLRSAVRFWIVYSRRDRRGYRANLRVAGPR